MLPTAESQPEVIEAMRQGLADNGDLKAVRDGEIGQGLAAGIVALREENLLVRAVQGAPFGDAAFKRTADAVRENLGAEFILELFENRDRQDAGDFEHLQNPRPGSLQWIRAGSPRSRLLLLGRKTRIFVDPARRALADAGHCRGGCLIMVL
jgi:hypothetical protein